MGWWIKSSLEQLEEAEKRLLAGSPNLKRYDVPTFDGCHIHTLEGGVGLSKTPLVLAHGYGQGAAAWFMNLQQFTENLHTYSTDWLGYGMSYRPIFTPRGVKETEDFFCSHMEKWREGNKIERMVLCGHSLGGYLSVAYAERYPDRIEKLVLASPVGIPEPSADFEEAVANMNWKRRTLINSARWLWSRGVTPGDLVRTMGPIGRNLMDRYSQMRFRDDQDGFQLDKAAFGEYLYHNAAATHGSGERALSQLLKPGAYAYEPLCHRIPKLDKRIPIFFIYGAHDWMDHTHAEAVKRTAPSDQKIEVITLAGAGHQLFLDAPQEFNEVVLRICGIPPDQIKPAPRDLAPLDTTAADLVQEMANVA